MIFSKYIRIQINKYRQTLEVIYVFKTNLFETIYLIQIYLESIWYVLLMTISHTIH